MCKAFAPLVIAAKGTIVQIGSIAALMPYVFGSAYNASKAALHAYSSTLRVELAPFDVKVITVVTGKFWFRCRNIPDTADFGGRRRCRVSDRKDGSYACG
jgi:NAD(P)-dependent dehydrogenase (short-subunit alcohol dehydrogenase family)